MTVARFDDLTPGAERAFRSRSPSACSRHDARTRCPACSRRPRRRPPRAVGRRVRRLRGGSRPEPGPPGPDKERRSPRRIYRVVHAVLGTPGARHRSSRPSRSPSRPRTRGGRRRTGVYDAAIARIREAIAAGDTYQVNHTTGLATVAASSRPVLTRRSASGASTRRTCRLDASTLSASPELFFRLDGDRVITRPMKERRPRTLAAGGRGGPAPPGRLQRSRRERDDRRPAPQRPRPDLRPRRRRVGRAVPPSGTRRSGITSATEGTLLPGTGVTEVFRALFPSGSVTGAPASRRCA